MEIQGYRFAVGETPVCVWSRDLQQANIRYLRGIDSEYFLDVARLLGSADLTGRSEQQRALAIRSIYAQAAEALLALLAAAAQAPDCVVGWISRYRNNELDWTVNQLSTVGLSLNRTSAPLLTWNGLAAIVFARAAFQGPEHREKCTQAFADFWARVANEHTDEHWRTETNAIKHGQRCRAGGFSFSIGLKIDQAQQVSDQEMTSLGGSAFGSSSFEVSGIAGTRCHYKLDQVSTNWDPNAMLDRISLISCSLRNVTSALLLHCGGDTNGVSFAWPEDLQEFSSVWNSPTGPRASTITDVIELKHVQNWSKEEILQIYARAPSA